MWGFGWLFNRDNFCKKEFPEIWSGFIDAYADTVAARGRSSCAPRDSRERPPRHQARFPAVKRLIAFGDVHGDVQQMRRAFQAAGIADENLRWRGGTTVAVQVGDILDRGDNEVEMFYALERLQKEAKEAGGALHVLNGNHETMNIAQDIRYASAGGCQEFSRWMATQHFACSLKKQCGSRPGWSEVPKRVQVNPRNMPLDPYATSTAHSRAAALQPGSPFTRRFMSTHPMVLQIGSTVFVHGGLHPEHVHVGVDNLNSMAQDWMEGYDIPKPWFLKGRDALVWSREYSHTDKRKCNCDLLQQTLEELGGKRMVVGHTIQAEGVNSACDNRVLRVDVGMSRGCGAGSPQALEIIDDKHLYQVLENGNRVPMNGPAPEKSDWKSDWSPSKWFRTPVAAS